MISSEGASRISSVLGLKARPQQADDLAARVPPSMSRTFRMISRALVAVDLHHGPQELEDGSRGMEADVGQRLDVLGEAGPAEAQAGVQELRADALVVAHARRHLLDIGAHLPRRCWRSR